MEVPHLESLKTASDLSDTEIAEINSRIHRALGRYNALPFHSLLYRLGEVGAKRVEERKLRRALAELSENRRPRRGKVSKGPHEPDNNIFVSSQRSANDAQTASIKIAEGLAELASYMATSEEAAQVLAHELGSARIDSTGMQSKVLRIAGKIDVTVTTTRIETAGPKRRSPVSILLTNDPGWLYPDDDRIWKFLVNCGVSNSHPIVVARAIAPGTFPLFKAIGVTGLQYYSTLVKEQHAESANNIRDEIGWTHVRALTTVRMHPFVEQLASSIDRLRLTKPATQLKASLERASQIGLQHQPRILDVIRWWQESAHALPEPVIRGWLRWVIWDTYRRGQTRSGASRANPSETMRTEKQLDSERISTSEAETGVVRGYGRETKVMPLGLRLPLREMLEILANSRAQKTR